MYNQQEMTRIFRDVFSREPLLVRAPGRINLIGEHTDYNDGFVLPAAISLGITVAISKSDNDTIRLYAAEFKEHHAADISDVSPLDSGWPNYILGVVKQLIDGGHRISGFNLAFAGNLPIGAGLSSSAALECAALVAITQIFQLEIPALSLALMAQQAEHQYAGVKCGIMDQYASIFGKAGHAIKLDCRSLSHSYIPLKMEGLSILLLNTNVQHELASSEYNLRRQECQQGLGIIQATHPGVKSLRDVSLAMLEAEAPQMEPLVYQRCSYVVNEIERVNRACLALQHNDYEALGNLMYATHEGLSRHYEVSCKELDFLVDQVKTNPAVLGARMMGGGFGGCTINLVKTEAIDGIIQSISANYKEKMGLELSAYVANVSNGAGILD